jgi:NhaP-type Na+/H+ or K+/H+ antiporter
MMENDGVVIHSQLANSVCVSSSCMGRQWMFRTRMAWIVLCLLLGWANQVQALQTATETDTEGDVIEKEIPEIESYHAVLFPSFTLTLGVFTFWILSRYAQALPYTGVLFLMGTIMGIGAEALNNSNQMNDTITQWVGINSEVLLLVFLPGLIYKDSFTLDVHLFTMALLQCFIFAFPMVLAGTTLTALVAYYIFPYNWSFNLAMTFGSILSATDPVSVAALLEEVGAPPRLRIHINGEAL